MLINSNNTLTVPTLPGMFYQCSGLGVYGGATVTLQTLVDGAYRPVPNGAFTTDFEIVRVNSAGTDLRAAVSGATGTTNISVTITQVRQ